MANSSSKKWRFWVDRGGTFTDLVAVKPDGQLQVVKLLSQSAHYRDAVVEGIRRAMGGEYEPNQVEEIRMGTTVATNAFLEKNGAPSALLTTLGFADLLELRQQNRPHLFDLHIQKIRPLYQVATEVFERIGADGKVITPLDEEISRFELQRLQELGIKSVAIALMHATVNPAHELRLAQIAEEVGFDYVSLSHQVSAMPKMISRGETAVVDAYLSPKLAEYTDRLTEQLKFNDILFMQSHGGLCSKDQLKGHNALLSGPAGGLIGAVRACQRRGIDKIITFDMGGTSTDVAIFDGSYQLDHQPLFHGLQLQTPMLEIHTVAAGGGSILHSDGRRLTVGPDSAGAFPGPACYRNGGPLTVTDANLLLGRIDASQFPSIFGPEQNQPLDETIVEKKFAHLAEELGESPENLARYFLDVAVETMAGAIRKVSVEKGFDPQDFTLCCFGGAGAQVACLVADRLSMKSVFVHPLSSVLSAFGMGLAEEKQRLSSTINRSLNTVDTDLLKNAFRELQTAVEKTFRQVENIEFRRFFQLRLSGSDHLIEVEATDKDQALTEFQRRYQEIFGIAADEAVHLQALTLEGFKARPFPAFADQQVDAQQKTEPQVISGNNTSLVIDPGWQGELAHDGSWRLCKTSSLVQAAERHRQKRHRQKRHRAAELEISYQRFQSIAEEMGHVLRNTGYSVNIKERLDYSCAIFTAEGELIANAPHMPVHLGSMSECVLFIDKKFRQEMQPGDCFISNSPLEGGTHLPDITLVSPVFAGNRLVFYVASRGHHADVGGISPGSMPSQSTRLAEEGVVIAARKLVDKGKFLENDIRQVFIAGPHPARNFQQNLHDLKAQLAANIKGISSLQKLIQENGLEKTCEYAQKLLAYSEERIREALRDFSSGHASLSLENGRRIEVRLTKSAQLDIDFTGTSASDPGNFNAPRPVVKAAVLYCLRCLLRENIPLNDGLARLVSLHLPENSLVNPGPESAVVAGNVETSQALCDALFEALGVLAHSQGTMNNLSFGDADHQYYETIAGGAGAGPTGEGASGVQIHMTNSRLTDPEVLESRFPVLVQSFSLRQGSGGRGLHNGGDGVYRRLQFLKKIECHFLSQRREAAPRGLQGGGEALPGQTVLFREDGTQEKQPACFGLTALAGDELLISTPGGGAFGRRPAEFDNHHLIFAYGSNLDAIQIKMRCPSAEVIGRAHLTDHELAFTRFSEERMGGVADIRACPGKKAWGLVYRIDDRDLLALDRFEGHPFAYQRIETEVVLDHGRSVKVMTYDVCDKEPHVTPSKLYAWLVYKGARRAQAPKTYLANLEKLLDER